MKCVKNLKEMKKLKTYETFSHKKTISKEAKREKKGRTVKR